MKITIKSFNGIGDLLFLTPSLRVIKKSHLNSTLIINTNYPELLKYNPYVDELGTEDIGLFLGYDDPIHLKHPNKHHIYSDWLIICRKYQLNTYLPLLKPEIYLEPEWKKPGCEGIGVQTIHANYWHNKKVWPYFQSLCDLYPCIAETYLKPIPMFPSVIDLVKHIASLKLVVCAEGGISHIARAMGTPAIVLYGGFAKPEWNGYKEQTNLCNYPQCGPCYNPNPCTGKFDRECFDKFTAAFVANKIEEILSEV